MSQNTPKTKTSQLWKFFTQVDDNYATCDTCHQTLSFKTSTSNLKKHLQSKHSSNVEISGNVYKYENSDDTAVITVSQDNGRSFTIPLHQKKELFTPTATEMRSQPIGTEKNDEFEAFGISIAAQLRNMPINDAIQLQMEIQQLITIKRLQKHPEVEAHSLSKYVTNVPTSS